MRALLLAAVVWSRFSSPAAAASDESWAAPTFQSAKAAFSAYPIPSAAPAALESEALRAAVLAQARKNPAANEFLAPILAKPGLVALFVAGESEDQGLRGTWAVYRRDSRKMILNRDAINEDLAALGGARPCELLVAGRPLTAAQLEVIARRYLPLFAHELGGHARNYLELGAILGKPAPNVRETEIDALRLEAMTIAAARKSDAGYLREKTGYAQGESALVDKYWEAKEKDDPSIFRDYVSRPDGYAKLPSALEADPRAQGPVAAYYKDDERRLLESDLKLVGDDPPSDEEGIGSVDPFAGISGGMRR